MQELVRPLGQVDLQQDLDLERLDPVPTPPAWEVVADVLRHKIEQGAYTVGDQLPAERQLAEQLDVSRTVVRDALRALQYEDLIQTRRGASGGPQVMRPPSRSEEQIRADLRRNLPQLKNTLDLRIGIETFAAHLAALERKDEHLEAMKKSVEEMEEALQGLDEALSALKAATSPKEEEAAKDRGYHETAKFRRGDTTFHLAVASATGNTAIVEEIEKLHTKRVIPLDALYSSYRFSDHKEGENNVHRIAIKRHKEIRNAIYYEKGSEAAERMWKHIEDTKAALLSKLLESEKIVTSATRAYEQLADKEQQESVGSQTPGQIVAPPTAKTTDQVKNR